MALQNIKPAHHLGMRRLAALVHAVGIVNLRGPVDRDADEKAVPRQKLAPLVVEQRAVGLECVLDSFVAAVLCLQLNHALEEWHSQQRWFAALPRK